MYVDLDHVSKTIKGKAVLRDVSVDNEWGPSWQNELRPDCWTLLNRIQV